MLAVQRADDPRLLQGGQPAPGVQLAHLHGGLDDIDVRDDGAQVAQPQRACGAQPLEAVEDLHRAAALERAHGRQLPVLLERGAHRGQRGRVGQAQARQALAEIGDGDEALGSGGGGHGREPTTTDSRTSRLVRDAVHAGDRSRAIFAGSPRGG